MRVLFRYQITDYIWAFSGLLIVFLKHKLAQQLQIPRVKGTDWGRARESESAETRRTERPLFPSLIILLHSCVFTGRAVGRTALLLRGPRNAKHLKSNPSWRSDDGEGDERRGTWKNGRRRRDGVEQMLAHEGGKNKQCYISYSEEIDLILIFRRNGTRC